MCSRKKNEEMAKAENAFFKRVTQGDKLVIKRTSHQLDMHNCSRNA